MSDQPQAESSDWTFIDLFAGIGGFHGALSALGGTCSWASEIDTAAAKVYERNWGLVPVGDIRRYTEPAVSEAVPRHDVLAAGFPCQPFSKSGTQQGFRDATRGTLFFDICQIIEARRPSVVLLENVRNLAGPRQQETWQTIVRSLRDLGYRVSDAPTVFSPHLLPPELGGTPQVRERVFIAGTYVGADRAWAEADDEPVVPLRPVMGWAPATSWDISDLLEDEERVSVEAYRLRESEVRWIDCWDDFRFSVLGSGDTTRLPGFPLWLDHFTPEPDFPDGDLEGQSLPRWKADFLRKNSAFYNVHRYQIDSWRQRWFPNWHPDWDDFDERGVWESPAEVDRERYAGQEAVYFPPSRRKLEWQAQDEGSLWDTVMHLRPSGIRAKRPTYLPALVAITQTSIYGPRRRRITPREAARLQGLPDQFDFGGQPDAATYKQLGNGVSIGAAYYVLRQHVLRDKADLAERAPALLRAVAAAGEKPILRMHTDGNSA